MSKLSLIVRKMLLVVLLIGAALPVSPAFAQEEQPPEIDYFRLGEAYDKLVEWYTYQTEWMDEAEDMIARTQDLIDRATARGYGASAVQSALDTFAEFYPQARPYNLEAADILETHAGFDEDGNVTDPEVAVETLKSLQAALQSAYETMGGENHAGGALIEAIKDFIESIRPISGQPAA